MERPLAEVIASQEEMLRRRGTVDATGRTAMLDAFKDHLREVRAWLETREDVEVCRIGYRKLLADPLAHAVAIRDFLGIAMYVEAMAREVDPSLYRNRG
jgi:LPS sulfotransferase NodH